MTKSLPRIKVWELIAPAVPDSLEDLGNGQYLAKWWKPVPMQDVETLIHTRGIRIHGEPYEPRNLPEGLSVLFSIEEEMTAEDIGDKAKSIETRLRSKLPLQKTGS
jgi:hypothetical protein